MPKMMPMVNMFFLVVTNGRDADHVSEHGQERHSPTRHNKAVLLSDIHTVLEVGRVELGIDEAVHVDEHFVMIPIGSTKTPLIVADLRITRTTANPLGAVEDALVVVLDESSNASATQDGSNGCHENDSDHHFYKSGTLVGEAAISTGVVGTHGACDAHYPN